MRGGDDMRRLLCAALSTLGAIAIASAQTPPPQRFTGCLQRSPSNARVFVLTNASNSPLGGHADDAAVPPPPARGSEPIERRPGQSDARQETGGVTYLLQGGTNL